MISKRNIVAINFQYNFHKYVFSSDVHLDTYILIGTLPVIKYWHFRGVSDTISVRCIQRDQRLKEGLPEKGQWLKVGLPGWQLAWSRDAFTSCPWDIWVSHHHRDVVYYLSMTTSTTQNRIMTFLQQRVLNHT